MYLIELKYGDNPVIYHVIEKHGTSRHYVSVSLQVFLQLETLVSREGSQLKLCRTCTKTFMTVPKCIIDMMEPRTI